MERSKTHTSSTERRRMIKKRRQRQCTCEEGNGVAVTRGRQTGDRTQLSDAHDYRAAAMKEAVTTQRWEMTRICSRMRMNHDTDDDRTRTVQRRLPTRRAADEESATDVQRIERRSRDVVRLCVNVC